MGFKAPRGYGWITNPKKAAYNRVYNRNTFKADGLIALAVGAAFHVLWGIAKALVGSIGRKSDPDVLQVAERTICPRCAGRMVLRDGRRGKFYGCSSFPHCRGTRDYLMTDAVPAAHLEQ